MIVRISFRKTNELAFTPNKSDDISIHHEKSMSNKTRLRHGCGSPNPWSKFPKSTAQITSTSLPVSLTSFDHGTVFLGVLLSRSTLLDFKRHGPHCLTPAAESALFTAL